MRYEMHNLDGTGQRRTQVFDVPSVQNDYWAAVTDVSCPCCVGTIRWAEAGYVPGYRICDKCGRHFLAKGNSEKPKLLRVRDRRSKVA
jgi:hypothetical protein